MSWVVQEHQRERSGSRVEWMDALRGMAILLVVLDHSADQVRSSIPESLETLTVFNDAASPFRMASLMFLSGLLLPKSLAKTSARYLKGKLANVGWPYVLWSFIILGLLAGTAPLTGNSVGVEKFLRIFYNPPTYLWYLAYLLVFYVVCLLIAPKVRTWFVPATLLASAVALDDLRRMLFLFAFFLLGDFAARNASAWKVITGNRWCLFTGALLGIVTAFFAGMGLTVRYEAVWAFGVIGGIIAAIPLLQRLAVTAAGKRLAAIGQNSIVFYVTHWSVMLVSYHLLLRAGITNPWALVALIFAAGLGSGFLMSAARERWPVMKTLYGWPRK